MRRAKILATIGPASRDPKIMEAMLAAGVDGVRINMSHGTREDKAADIQLARTVAEKMNRPLAVLRVQLARCWQTDAELKSGRTVPVLALERLVIELCESELVSSLRRSGSAVASGAT